MPQRTLCRIPLLCVQTAPLPNTVKSVVGGWPFKSGTWPMANEIDRPIPDQIYAAAERTSGLISGAIADKTVSVTRRWLIFAA